MDSVSAVHEYHAIGCKYGCVSNAWITITYTGGGGGERGKGGVRGIQGRGEGAEGGGRVRNRDEGRRGYWVYLEAAHAE